MSFDGIDQAAANHQAGLLRRTPLSFRLKTAYGVGAMVDGLVSTAVNLYLFFYLTAVCGLSGSLTGTSLFVALVVDAVADPLIGSMSDHHRSRWGRRHAFMVWGILPIAVAFGLLFTLPPQAAGWGAFAYVTLLSILLRVGLSAFNVPYAALGAELTDDYVERSSVVSYRLLLGIVGSVSCMALGPLVFFRGADGMLQRAAYGPFAWSCAALVVLSALASIFGTLGARNRLHQSESRGGNPLMQLLKGGGELFRNPSFLALFICEVLYFVALGVSNTLTFHAFNFFYHIPQAVIQTILIAGCAGTPIGVWLNTYTSRHFEKRTVVIAGVLITCVSQAALPLLKIAGWLPAPGPGLTALMIANSIFLGAIITTESVAFYSMLADAADEHEHRFQVRREGLYFAGLSFAIKASSGLGSLIAGVALDLIHFPAALVAKGGALPPIAPETLLKLGLIYGPGVAVLTLLAGLALLNYRLDRAAHGRIQEELSQRRIDLMGGTSKAALS
jgi:GPH family glycoside/pentoside/hexuronide:cation symporter